MNEPAPDFSNSAYLFPHINSEGFRFGFIAVMIAVLVLVALALVIGHGLKTYGVLATPLGLTSLLSVLFTLVALLSYGVFLFFRDPVRYPPADEKAILSPADGRVCLIGECELPDSLGELPEYRGRKFWRVSVFMSVFDVHVNRLPTAGEILKKEYVAAGKFFNASLDKASKENERCNYLVKAVNGQVYGVTQIAGLVARRIVPQVTEGQKLERAQRFGLIRFGSRLDIYLPEGVEPCVRVGQTMISGETVLGYLK